MTSSRKLRFYAILLISPLMWACHNNDMLVNTQADAALQGPPAPGTRMDVQIREGVHDPAQAGEALEKVKNQVQKKGYVVASSRSNAEYVLVFDYGFGEPRYEKTDAGEFSYYGLFFGGSKGFPKKGKWVVMALYPAGSFKGSNQSPPIWQGRIDSDESSANLQSELEYLAAGGLRYLGKNTGSTKQISVSRSEVQAAKQENVPNQ